MARIMFTVRCYNHYATPNNECAPARTSPGLSYDEAAEERDDWAGMAAGNYSVITGDPDAVADAHERWVERGT